MPTRAETAKRRNTDALAKMGRLWLPPDRALLVGYAPKSKMERQIVKDVLVPTLRHYAAEVVGHPSPIADVRNHVLFAKVEGLRYALYDCWPDTLRPDPDRILSAPMWAAAWYAVTDEERGQLARYLETGLVLLPPAPEPAFVTADMWGAGMAAH